MKGNNTINVNTGTIIEAVQEYLDKRYSPKIKVTNVEKHSNGYNDDFKISVEEIKEV